MQHSKFVHLHLHSNFSLLDGTISIPDLIDRAHEYKMPAVAVTDHGNIFSAIDFYKEAMKKGVKPIIGCEVYIAARSRFDKTPNGIGQSTTHLVLLVKNETGYRNLCKLLSTSFIDGFYYKPRIDLEVLREHSEGLIALSACLHGYVAYPLTEGKVERAVEAALQLKDIFDEKCFYLELQDHGMDLQKKVNEEMIKISIEHDIPLVATNDCHYLEQKDSKMHDVLICIQTAKTVDDPLRMKYFGDQFYFKSPEEMEALFAHVPEALSNTIDIAERCNLEMTFGEHYLPNFPLPEGTTLDKYLEDKSREGLKERLAHISGTEDLDTKVLAYHERLDKELKVINRMGFPGYFLIVADFIDYAKDNDIPVGPGRGSAAGSLVAFCLGITNVDPIKYNLLFERFLNPDRISLPDIDIDFCYEGRDRVIKYVSDKYGRENVSQIITFGVMKAKAVIRDVGRALDIPYADVDRIAKLIPNQLNITLDIALKEEPKIKQAMASDKRIAELIEVAKQLEGAPRHASTHAAGVVIGNKPLVEYLPLYMEQKNNVITTQFKMVDVEDIGLVKFDFLGIKTLTIIDRAVKTIKKCRDVDIDIENLELDDKATYKLLSVATTQGVFQLESSGMRELLRKLKPTTFEDLMAAVALYRPGPLQSGMVDDFIKRKHKEVAISYDLPELEPILHNTYGVMVYQEQVMEIAKVLAGYTPGDADVLRKAMGKKVASVMVNEKNKFMEGTKVKKINQKTAEKIFDLMAHFAGYGFNKSHSAAYAMIAYQTAYLKAHYPVEFMASLLSSNMGDTDKIIRYINECKDMGIKVMPPDINDSNVDFTVHGSTIRFGLVAIKGVGEAAIESIIEARRDPDAPDGDTVTEKPFAHLADMLARVDGKKVNKKVIENLVKCGAFDFTDRHRAETFESIPQALDLAQSAQQDKQSGQGSIFDVLSTSDGSTGTPEMEYAKIEPWEKKVALSFEKDALGFYISSHPLMEHKEELELYADSNSESLKDRRTGSTVTIGGVVGHLKETTTKRGSKMAFVTLEDLHGSVELVIFSDVYSDAVDYLKSDAPILITGKLEKDAPRREKGKPASTTDEGVEAEDCKILVTEIVLLEEAKTKRSYRVFIDAQSSVLPAEKIKTLKDILKAHPGTSTVFLKLTSVDNNQTTISLPDNLRIAPDELLFKEIRESLNGVDIKVA